MVAEVITPAALRAPALPADLYRRGLALNRDRVVLRAGSRRWTGAGLADEVSRYAQAFDALGLVQGSPIAVLAGNIPEVLILLTANTMVGTRYTPLHPLGSLDDHIYVLNDSRADTLFYDPSRFEERAQLLAHRVPTLRNLIALGPSMSSRDLPSLASAHDPQPLSSPLATPDTVVQVSYSGGTTGRPKGVVATAGGQAAMAGVMLAEWDLPSSPTFLCCTPLSHAGRTAFLPVLLRGGEFIVLDGFDPQTFAESANRHQVDSTMLVPTMIYRLLDAGVQFDSLRRLYYGASAISPQRLAEALDRWGSIMFQFYGQVECPMTITVMRCEDHDRSRPHRLVSCGRPVPWVDVTLQDPEGNVVTRGERGELCVRAPFVMQGYHGEPELTAAAFEGGWLHTGDIAIEDDDGFLTIVDRVKDVIVTGGFNVYPREIEVVLADHPAVAEVAVIGVPDDHWGEAVKAIIVRRPGMTVAADEVVNLVRERKGLAAAPKSVEFVDAIPLSGLGKPDKKALRAHYWADGDRQVH